MATKKFKLLSSRSVPAVQPTDWTFCALCQQPSSESLIDPSKSKNKSQSTGYEMLADNLQSLDELNPLPLTIKISRLDDGTGIEEMLKLHNAKWHKTCYVMYNKTKVNRARKKVVRGEHSSPLKDRFREAFSCMSQSDEKLLTCFFCDTLADNDFHKAATKQLDANVRKMATELNDTHLMVKLVSGDMVATDAVYHKQCLTVLFTRHRSSAWGKKASAADDKLACAAIAFAELVSYIEELRDTGKNIVKLSNVVQLHKSHVEQLGGDTSQCINAMRLKEKLLAQIQDLDKNMMSFFLSKTDIGDTLMEGTRKDHDNDAVSLMWAAAIIRKDIFQIQNKFKGSLLDEQYDTNSTSC